MSHSSKPSLVAWMKRSAIRGVAWLAMVTSLQTTASAATVQQGDDGTNLHSPMILSGPFPLANPQNWGEPGMFGKVKYTDPAIYSDFYRYHCDGVAITEMKLRGEPSGDNLKVHLSGIVDGKIAGHDKKYVFNIELLDADNPVYSTEQDGKVEEHDRGRFNFYFKVPQSALQADPETTMRITMRTYDY